MAQKDLIPYHRLTEEQQKKLTHAGGIASAKARREKKQMRELVRLALEEVAEGCDDKSRLEVLAARYATNLMKKRDLNGDDVQKLQKILGEEVTTVTAEVVDPAKKLNDLMNGR